jgi:hypothetical protein
LLVVAPALGTLRLEVRVVLPELLLRRRDQAEVVLRVLKVVFGRDRIAGRMGVARKLKIFLGDMIGCAANLHVGAVGFINPRQRIMISAVIVIVVVIIIVVVAPAHALVVIVMLMLTVSHGLLFNNSQLAAALTRPRLPQLHSGGSRRHQKSPLAETLPGVGRTTCAFSDEAALI